MQAIMTPARRQAWRYTSPMVNYDEIESCLHRGRHREDFRAGCLNSIQEGFETGQLVPEDFNIQKLGRAVLGGDLFNAIVNAPEGRGPQGWISTHAQEAGAVELSDFSNITGQIYFSAIMDAYTMERTPFFDLIPSKHSPIPGVEKLPGISNLGDGFETVAETDQYPLMGVSEDWIQVGEKRKKGGIVPISKEALMFDLTGVLMDRAQALGPWMKVDIEKYLIDMVLGQNQANATIYAGGAQYTWKGTPYATYQTSTPWINVTTSNGLSDWTSINKALITGSKIVDPYTGEPFPFEPKHLVVAPDNLFNAKRVVHATTVFVATPGFATSGSPNVTEVPNPVDEYQIVSSRLLGARMDLASEARTDWFLTDLTRAFARFYNWDVTPEQSAPNSHEAFYRDIIVAHKISKRDVFATIQPRVSLKNTA